MKKFNLFKEIVTANKQDVLQAINSAKVFAINYKGELKTPPYADKEILIFEGAYTAKSVSALTPTTPFKIGDFFGSNYRIVEENESLLIKASSNWQALIALNTPRSSYDDTTADGIAEFSDKELEKIGWHATEFDITYREIVENMEEKCEGIILCIEQEEPQYKFSGLGFLFNDADARAIAFEQVKGYIADKIKTDSDFAPATLNDDEREAAQFFSIL